MHPILRYCEEKDLSQRVFSDLVGLSPSYVSEIVLGKIPPGRGACEKIEAATDGEVRIEVLIKWRP